MRLRLASISIALSLLVTPSLFPSANASDDPSADESTVDHAIDPSVEDEFVEEVIEKQEGSVKEALNPKQAISVDLTEVVESPEMVAKPEQPPSQQHQPFVILGSEVKPGISTRLAWSPGIHIAGLASPTPVLVINGVQEGPTLCLTAAIHGDELNGIEIIRRVVYEINPKKLTGKIIAVPIVNLQGFRKATRYLPDRRDLNRHFPGNPEGSLASRIAYSLFSDIISHCSYLIDVHTGSMLRNNLPQIRADMHDPRIAEFASRADNIAVVHSPGTVGMLRHAAALIDIPSITIEAGESLRIQENYIDEGVKAVQNIIERLDMYKYLFVWGASKPVFYQSQWVRASRGGILFSKVEVGDHVKEFTLLGTIIDPITNEKSLIYSPYEGKIIGKANDQVVMPGFAAYHIGIDKDASELISDSTPEPNAELSEEADSKHEESEGSGEGVIVETVE